MLTPGSRIFVAGHQGLVGRAITTCLQEQGYSNLILKTHAELDLSKQGVVEAFFEKERPEVVVLAAAKVGGILANNTYKADFIYENLAIQTNTIHCAYKYGVQKLLFLGSTCIYPKECAQPIKEEYLLTSPLEPTNEPYAIAKIAGLKMCEAYNAQHGTNFISAMPTNLYGEFDNFDLQNSHVLPALLRKLHLAKLLEENQIEAVLKDLQIPKEQALGLLAQHGVSAQSVQIWGSGAPRREFLHVRDLAHGCVFLLKHQEASARLNHTNIGTGEDISIKDLAHLMKEIVGFKGELVFDPSKPDGTLLKRCDVSKISSLGWKAGIKLEEGIRGVYSWYLAHH
ncbi:Nodulation protein [Helicobacter sp. NHP19-003]|uniref:GDP-L-fucose synthase n=1 Tax=Helicobacter gastrocanis TaxID=2849641 RepID=A0ABM7S9T6_9HELI|nr:GDP-L-fucose synthase [Helicobacter sp. NHP19-003]BCZ17140.1 Nodulation protein [Helicobacter sp. NHP19-003]